MKKTKHWGIEQVARRKYRVRVRGKDPRNGKLKEVDRIIEEVDLAEAKRIREQLYIEITQGEIETTVERMTVRAFAKSWSAERAPRLKWSTLERYANALDHYILPALGDFYFDTLTRRDVEAWVTSQTERLKPESINGNLRILKSLCRDASDELGIPDPSARVRPIPLREIENRRNALTADELRRLLAVAKESSPDHYPLLLTLAMTGMRWGEATALKWRDIDEQEKVIRVVRAHYHGHVSSPKNGKRRTYPLLPELAEVLRAHRQVLEVAQHPGLSADWVFATTAQGDPNTPRLRYPSAWSKLLPKWLASAKITKHITPHSLRRTNVDLLRRAQVDAVVARSLVGHATEAMREHYSTVDIGEQREAMNRVANLIRGGERSESGGSSGGSL
jgi:integrase